MRGRIVTLGIALVGMLTVAVQAYRAPADRALLRAVESGNLASARVLLQDGANPNARDNTPYRSCTEVSPPPMRRPALTFAVQNKDLEMVQLLLAHGADPNACETAGSSPMYCAALGNQIAMLRALAAAGGDLNLRAGQLASPLQPEMLLHHTPAGDWLAARGARMLPRDTSRDTVVGRAHYLESFEKQREAAERERDQLRPPTADGWAANVNPLVETARVGGVTELRRLLDAGADVNAQDDHGRTALMVALGYGCHGTSSSHAYLHNPQVANNRRREMAQLLLEPRYGLRINGGGEARAVFRAAVFGNDNTLRSLLAAGGDANATSAGGFTALMAGVASENVEVMQQLLAAGANANTVCGRGWTAGAWLNMSDFLPYRGVPNVIKTQRRRWALAL